ncbi:MAG: FMN-binding negative transcriptional regulator, partial [Bacteroidetes bacterium]|nr:FMN-binding negative transcriptional regulator [Bacteroidota bacterium]
GQEQVIDFMRQHPFAILCGVDEHNRPVATHVPVLIEERDEKLFLTAHVMRKQDHTNVFAANQNVLAIFYGPHTYVSASWYEDKKVAGTWNYQAVHASGILQFLNEEQLRDVLTKLTERFENNPHSPSLVQKMDRAYVDKMMQAVVAFEIEVQSLQHVFKLSQNRDEASYKNIIGNLADGDADAKAVSELMKQNADNVFKKNEKRE